jgi:hypothetical protein
MFHQGGDLAVIATEHPVTFPVPGYGSVFSRQSSQLTFYHYLSSEIELIPEEYCYLLFKWLG